MNIIYPALSITRSKNSCKCTYMYLLVKIGDIITHVTYVHVHVLLLHVFYVTSSIIAQQFSLCYHKWFTNYYMYMYFTCTCTIITCILRCMFYNSTAVFSMLLQLIYQILHVFYIYMYFLLMHSNDWT